MAEAHKRGLELHAWFNPYKAHHTKDTAVAARNQVVRDRPDIVYPYGHFVWMEPGIPEVRRRALRAVMDVVRRYDVDGVHIDDFFYPIPKTTPPVIPSPFPIRRHTRATTAPPARSRWTTGDATTSTSSSRPSPRREEAQALG